MGSKKDTVKEALGISEYPWSSDDDEMMNRGTNTQDAETNTQPRHSTTEARNNSVGSNTQREVLPREGSNPTSPEQSFICLRTYIPRGTCSRVVQSTDNGHQRECSRSYVPSYNERRQTSSCQGRPSGSSRDRPRRISDFLESTRSTSNVKRFVAFKKFTRNLHRDKRRTSNSCSSRSNSDVVWTSYLPLPSDAQRSAHSRSRSEARTYPNRSTITIFNHTIPTEHDEPRPSSSGLQQSQNDLFRDREHNNNAEGNQLVAPKIEIDSEDDGAAHAAEAHARNDQPIQESAEGPSHSRAEGMMSVNEVTETPRETDINGNQNIAMVNQVKNESLKLVIKTSAVSTSAAQPSGEQKNLVVPQVGEIRTVKEFNQGLLRLLECPVCLDWMEPPISQCRRGHLVCGRCRSRLTACPVCRSMFSSVRNRAMEGVADLLRYPCRHGCGREVKLRRRRGHEASCPARKYLCPASSCNDRAAMPHAALAIHLQSFHFSMLKIGVKHKMSIKVNAEFHDNWFISAFNEFFHLRIDVDFPSWGIIVYVAYIGPKCKANNFIYEVNIDGQHNARKVIYSRTTHSDLESSALNLSRQDCFHITLDQALNFLRVKNRNYESEKFLDFQVTLSEATPDFSGENNSDS